MELIADAIDYDIHSIEMNTTGISGGFIQRER